MNLSFVGYTECADDTAPSASSGDKHPPVLGNVSVIPPSVHGHRPYHSLLRRGGKLCFRNSGGQPLVVVASLAHIANPVYFLSRFSHPILRRALRGTHLALLLFRSPQAAILGLWPRRQACPGAVSQRTRPPSD